MNNDLLLLSKNDVPFKEANINIHQPTIKEISLIGEENFHLACQFLIFSKNNLTQQDKSVLEDRSDFDIIMSIMNEKQGIRYRIAITLLLTLLFPQFEIIFERTRIILKNDTLITDINSNNFDIFKDIVISIFDIDNIEEGGKYNPSDGLANKIAEKFKKRQQQLAKQKGENLNKVSIFNRYVSILAVGLQKDMNELMEYTVYQLKDEFKRFQLKQNFDFYRQARLAGAQDLDEVDNWMDDIHP